MFKKKKIDSRSSKAKRQVQVQALCLEVSAFPSAFALSTLAQGIPKLPQINSFWVRTSYSIGRLYFSKTFLKVDAKKDQIFTLKISSNIKLNVGEVRLLCLRWQ